MTAVEDLITENIDVWTSAIKRKSSAGRGGGKKVELYGVKKLRELILDLAVRGLLVPQDPSDEPASELLKRIATERAEIMKGRKIKALPNLDLDTLKILPEGWEYVRFGELTEKLGSGSTPKGGQKAYIDKGIPILRSQNVWNEGLSLSDVAFIPPETHEAMQNTKVFEGDVLLNITGASLGRSTIYQCEYPEANVNQHVTIIRLIEKEMRHFVHLGILSPLIQQLVWGRQVGMAIEGLSKKVLELFEFPIPPLAEQHRIVAKVDELMALCDQLELQTETSLVAHQTLVKTLLDALTQAATQPAEKGSTVASSPSPFEQAWHRLAEHFDTVFTTEDSIEQLKQTILQLAVMGKLVPQDPNDEPASELLKRIAAEKSELVKAKKIKKQKVLPEIPEKEKLFNLPAGWVWVRLGSVSNLKGGFAYKSKDFVTTSDHQVIRMGNVRPDLLRSLEKPVFINSSYAKDTSEYRITESNILLTMTGTKGKRDYLYSLLVTKHDLKKNRLYLNQRLCMISAIDLNIQYLNTVLKDDRLLDAIYAKSTGSANQANIGMDAISNWIIPLPPKDEQKRIFQKLEASLTLCDELKAHLTDTQATKLHLADAIVETVNQSTRKYIKK